mmetsp:Transcript_18312/g.69318  ORF Transcript_18312/g.69318 Transcript_18312/m.69318 type:complete len:154 (-) Transcript_18312:68-529(-)
MSTVTAFEAAITAGDLTKVARALDRGQDVNARLSSGRTPCHVAAMLGHKDLVQLLLDRGANIEATDEWGRSPCHEAASAGHKDALQHLLDCGANVEATDRVRTQLKAFPASVATQRTHSGNAVSVSSRHVQASPADAAENWQERTRGLGDRRA